MSKHSRTRPSRPLIAALGLTLAVGGGAYLYQSHRNHPATDSAIAAPPLKAVAANPVAPAVLDVKPTAKTPRADVQQVAIITRTPMPGAADAVAPMRSAGPATRPGVRLAAEASAAPATPAASPAGTPAAPDPSSKAPPGELVAARQELNASLAQGRLSPTQADATRKQLSDINKTLFFSKKRFNDDPYVEVYQVKSGDRLARIADHHGVTWELLCRINGMSNPRKLRSGQWLKIPKGPFHCVVTKSAYRLDLYLGSPGGADALFVMSFPVGLGKENSTPTGEWLIASGAKAHPATYYSPRGEGVIAADDPKNPLGGYWMGLTGVSGNAVAKESYGIHGTIDPDSIGKQASMGCIRLAHEDIAFLYDLLVDGKSKVVIRD